MKRVCVLKKIWLWTAVNRKTKKLVGYFVGDRISRSFEKFCENISHIDANFMLQINSRQKNILLGNPILLPLNARIVLFVITLLALLAKLISGLKV